VNGLRLRTALLIVLLAAVLTFILQNWQFVPMKFLGLGVTAPLGVLALGAYLLGMLSGWAVFSFVGRSLRSVAEAPKNRV
jgi:uncharacterized integral membrane protein